MKTLKGVEFVTVGDLTRELKEFKNEHSEDEVVCDMPDEDTCYVSGIEVDDDGDLCINLDDEEYDGDNYDVSMLLAELEGRDPKTKAYMAGCGKYLTFRFFDGNHIFAYDEGNDAVGCDGIVFGEYEEVSSGSGWLTDAERRELAENAKVEKRREKGEAIVVLILTILAACGLLYGVYALVVHKRTIFENILWIVACLIVFVVGFFTFYYSKDEKK